jgi:hypothetical protein
MGKHSSWRMSVGKNWPSLVQHLISSWVRNCNGNRVKKLDRFKDSIFSKRFSFLPLIAIHVQTLLSKFASSSLAFEDFVLAKIKFLRKEILLKSSSNLFNEKN